MAGDADHEERIQDGPENEAVSRADASMVHKSLGG